MATRPILDFTHLTPSERIELAEQLWDSLPENIGDIPDDQLAELRRRRALMDNGPPGRPWQEILDEIEKRGR
ncbi:MAG: addiction module protein [Gemmatimonadales bacterium]